MLCWMKDIRYLRRHGPKVTIKRRAVRAPRQGVSQENQDQILALKSQTARGRVGGEFCVADTASVALSNSKSRDESKKKKKKMKP